MTTTQANEADVEQVEDLLHRKEEVVHADAGYTGAQTRVERKGLRREIAAKRGQIRAMKDGHDKRAIERIEKRKASIRAWVEHPFRVKMTGTGAKKPGATPQISASGTARRRKQSNGIPEIKPGVGLLKPA